MPDINNLMTVDTYELLYFYWAVINLFSSVSKLCFILILLYYKMGKLMYLGLYILIGSFFLNLIITSFQMYFYEKEYEKKDVRVAISKDVIEGIKSIKYLCWEEIFEKKIMKLRG
jgi:ABC-type bacteriocin/lantibiotic exporter with double-glycine peptidase domain